jgi:nucleoside-diphosphate-sugar epimerase
MTMNVITEEPATSFNETAVLTQDDSHIIGLDDLILITGASGFIGPALVDSLLRHGFRNLRVFTRPSSNLTRLENVANAYKGAQVEMVRGNLLSKDNCLTATKGAVVIFHLATGGDKSFPDAFMNSVVTTRNLLDATMQHGCLRRFVNISSFAVYTNTGKGRWRMLDESCPVESDMKQCADAYSFAKIKQDELVAEYGKNFHIPYVTVRPGSVFGPGKTSITGRVGIDSFGPFLHMGGGGRIPLTYVDNCADAIVLAGVKKGVEGEIFNVVDDNVPTSRKFLRLYKRKVKRFRSFYVPHFMSYMLCLVWEKYANWSEGQLPVAFNRRRWHTEWKKTRYSNEKLKKKLGWTPKVSMKEGLERYFAGCREKLDA